MAALALIADSELPERAPVLADFRARWQHDPLVLDKWFTVQATARHAETLARVRALLADPAFSIRNPNKVRSLIGAFATGNPVRFHAADAAATASWSTASWSSTRQPRRSPHGCWRALSRWRRFDSARQALMRGQARAGRRHGGAVEGCLRDRARSLEG